MLYVRREGTYSSAKVERSLCDSLQANSPCGVSREFTREPHAKRDASVRPSAPRSFAARARVLSLLTSLAILGELASTLLV